MGRAELIADPRPRLPVSEVAAAWGCSEEKIVWLVRTGKLEAFSVSPAKQSISGIRIFPLEVETKQELAQLEMPRGGAEPTLSAAALIWRMRLAIEHAGREPGGFVYFIQCAEFVKIGFSARPRNRKKDLQGSNPHRLRIIKVIEGSEWHENAIHNALPGYLRLRRRNEWFHLTKELREAICMLPSADRKAWR